MKRSPELSPLSHDHHQALFVAQRLSRTEDVSQGATELLAYWQADGKRHFGIEEAVLLPAWIELDAKADRALAARVADEHLAIRTVVRRAQSGALGLDELREAGRLLVDHVRFEERQLFPLIEAGVEADALAELGEEIILAEGDPLFS